VPAFLYASNLEVVCPDLGPIRVDVAYGGNFYAIVDPQENFKGIENHTADQLISWSRVCRKLLNEQYQFVHPENENIKGLSHLLWTGKPMAASSSARNAVFYGDKAIDRSPCGTGTSARMAQWYAKGLLKKGDAFIHESIIGSTFTGRIESETTINGLPAIVPSIEGWAKVTGYNTIIIDDDDPYAHGFQVI
jgi:4-hydroxyproline epimerase